MFTKPAEARRRTPARDLRQLQRTGARCHGTLVILTLLSVCFTQQAGVLAQSSQERTEHNSSDVYVGQSSDVEATLQRGRSLAKAGRWPEAAELYDRALEEAGRHLIQESGGVYVSLRRAIGADLLSWPQAGVNALRALSEEDAAVAARDAIARRSMDDLLAVLDRYFITESAGRMVDFIADLAIESGDFATAIALYERAFITHPDRNVLGEYWRAKATLASAMVGEERFDLSVDPGFQFEFLGAQQSLSEAIEYVRENYSAPADNTSDANWPTFGGDASRNRRLKTSVEQLGPLWRFSDFNGSDSRGHRFEQGVFCGVAIAGELVVVQAGREVVGLDRRSGDVRWRFGDASSAGEETEECGASQACLNPTVHRNFVYATLPACNLGDDSIAYQTGSQVLVCLSARFGLEKWRVDAASVGLGRSALFDSAPLVDRGRVFVVVRQQQGGGIEGTFLLSVHADTGEQRFITPLSSASAGQLAGFRGRESIVSMRAGRVFVCTNAGSIAAISADTGDVVWLRTYQRDRIRFGREVRFPVSYAPCTANPIVFDDKRLICLPTDAMRLLVLSADSGDLLGEIPAESIGWPVELLGVSDGVVCTAGSQVVLFDLSGNKELWSVDLPSEAACKGRSHWAEDRVFVPMEGALSSLRTTDGTRVVLPWNSEGSSGVVLALRDEIFVAGWGFVACYVDRSSLYARLEKAMESAPSELDLAIELAEVTLSCGDSDRTLYALDEAAIRMRGGDEPATANQRSRLTEVCTLLAESLSESQSLTAVRANELLDLAAVFASSVEDQADYRLRFAVLFESLGEHATALRLYQEVLRDSGLRSHRVSGLDGVEGVAGTIASRGIDRIISTAGREIYSPHESEAVSILAEAERSLDEGALKIIGEVYPNSIAAANASVLVGDRRFLSGDYRSASRQYQTAYRLYSDRVDRSNLALKIAVAYERAGIDGRGYRWLSRVSAGEIVQIGDQKESLEECRQRLDRHKDDGVPSRPSLRLPLAQHFVREFSESASLMVPRLRDYSQADWSRVFVYEDGQVISFTPDLQTELWRTQDFRLKPELLLCTADVTLLASLYEVKALDTNSGKVVWSAGHHPESISDSTTDWEKEKPYLLHRVAGSRLVSLRSDGQLSCTLIKSGKKQWERVLTPRPIHIDGMTDELLCYTTREPGGSESSTVAVDMDSGEQIYKLTPPARPSVRGETILTDDHQILIITNRELHCYDAWTGRLNWRSDQGARMPRSSRLVVADGMCYSPNGRQVVKVGLDSGERLWQSERFKIARRGGLTLADVSDGLIAMGERGVSGLELSSGETIWEGTAPQNPRFIWTAVSSSYVVAIHMNDGGMADAIFYDHRLGSGLVPEDGGYLSLGSIDESRVRAILVVDDALLVQIGETIQSWAR